MGDDCHTNERTHEPSLREIVAELDGFKQRMQERDRFYLEKFKAQDEKTTLAMNFSEKAISKAENAVEKRFESVNEFRKSLSDQTTTFLSKSEAEPRFASLSEKVDNIRTYQSEGGGRRLGITSTMAAVAVIATLLSGLVFGILSLILKK